MEYSSTNMEHRYSQMAGTAISCILRDNLQKLPTRFLVQSPG